MSLRLVRVDDLDAVDRLIRPLRHLVLRAGHPFETTRFAGDDHPEAIHLVIVDDDAPEETVLGCASASPNAPSVALHPHLPAAIADDATMHWWQMRGVAVVDAARGRGIGRRLVTGLADAVRAHAPTQPAALWANARVGALGLYANQGYDVVGDVFELPLAGPHRLVWRIV